MSKKTRAKERLKYEAVKYRNVETMSKTEINDSIYKLEWEREAVKKEIEELMQKISRKTKKPKLRHRRHSLGKSLNDIEKFRGVLRKHGKLLR